MLEGIKKKKEEKKKKSKKNLLCFFALLFRSPIFDKGEERREKRTGKIN